MISAVLLHIPLGLHGKACDAVPRDLREQRAGDAFHAEGEGHVLERRKMAERSELFHKLRRTAAHAFLQGKDVAVAVAEAPGERGGDDGVRRVREHADIELSFRHRYLPNQFRLLYCSPGCLCG